MGSVKILIAEDHPLTIAGLNMLVDTHSEWHNCGQVTDGAKVVAEVREKSPDVLILDLALPNRTGLDLLNEIKKQTGFFGPWMSHYTAAKKEAR